MYRGKYLLLSVKYLVLFSFLSLCLRVGQIRFIAVNIY